MVNNTVQSNVTEQLRKMIFTYQLRPGERLVQDELAALLKVSRTPVREAIRQLESEGLVNILPYKGASVAVVTAEELEGIYQVRIALESHGTRLAMRNLKASDITVLSEMVDEMREAALFGEPERSLNVNRKFYIYFYGLAKQNKLFDLIVSHLDSSRRFRQQHFYIKALSARTLESHEKLLELIRQKDEEKVVQMVASELQRAADELLEVFQKTTSHVLAVTP